MEIRTITWAIPYTSPYVLILNSFFERWSFGSQPPYKISRLAGGPKIYNSFKEIILRSKSDFRITPWACSVNTDYLLGGGGVAARRLEERQRGEAWDIL